jgi:hypothetical protein
MVSFPLAKTDPAARVEHHPNDFMELGMVPGRPGHVLS